MVEGVTCHLGMGALELLSPSPPCVQPDSLAPRASPPLSMVSPPHYPPFLYPDLAVDVPGHGKVVVDIGYGGTFYAFLSAEQLGLDVCSSKNRDLVSAASAVTEAVKKQVWQRAVVPQCVWGDCARLRPFIQPVPSFQPHVEFQSPPPAS